MNSTEIAALAIAAIQIANIIRKMAQEKVEEDENLTLDQKRELIARIDAAMASVSKIE